jgi:cell wall-associated NlpC family hydrolase
MATRISQRMLLRGLIGILALAMAVTVAAQRPAGAQIPGCLGGEIVAVAATPSGAGYWLVGSDGGVFSFGDAQFKGSAANLRLNKPVVDIVSTASGAGYWLIAADGGVFAYGDAQAPADNPLPGMQLNQPVVAGIRQGTSGLVLTAGDGGVFALGGAQFYGSANNLTLAKPVSGIAATADDRGYWLTARDGGLFAYGNAGFYGNAVPATTCTPPSSTTGARIVQIATDIMNQKAVSGWGGGYALPYAWGGGHGTKPGPSYGTCGSGYSGPQPCTANSTFGVDCSGFTRWVYAIAYGSDVLGAVNTNGQIARLRKVTAPQPGDLVFFGTSSTNTHHVGIYVGNGRMINALQTGTVIRQDPLLKDFVGYYRY